MQRVDLGAAEPVGDAGGGGTGVYEDIAGVGADQSGVTLADVQELDGELSAGSLCWYAQKQCGQPSVERPLQGSLPSFGTISLALTLGMKHIHPV
jgi:hypothetical protein